MDEFTILSQNPLGYRYSNKYIYNKNIFLKIEKCADFMYMSKHVAIVLSGHIYFHMDLDILIAGNEKILNHKIIEDDDYYYVYVSFNGINDVYDFTVFCQITSLYTNIFTDVPKISLIITNELYKNIGWRSCSIRIIAIRFNQR